jgi:hypothetical protein
LTRDEFIDWYMANSRIPASYRTGDGFRFTPPDLVDRYGEPIVLGRVALPCYCGDEKCRGWAMVPLHPDLIELHQRTAGRPRREGDDVA